ncbi:MAG: lamin tail domain-containing protein, partial [Elusimicrobiales bacterium]|nr:lamin tail domain-containing protein [Elusimicrobiales bacterium]
LEVISISQDVDDFDVKFESISGDIMIVWANSAGANGTNGAWYVTAGGTPNHIWGTPSAMPTFADDATNLDLSVNPDTNEMIFASIGNAGADLQIGYWDGGAWSNEANTEKFCATPAAGTKLVATGWLTFGAVTRSIIAYNNGGATAISWYVGNGGTFTEQTNASSLPAFADPQSRYDIKQDPVNKDKLMLIVSDSGSKLVAKQLVMDSAPNFTWTDANNGNAIETNLASSTVGGYSFFFWPSTPTSTFNQAAYRFFENTDTEDVGSPLAAQDTSGILETAGAAFRLRTLIHIDQVELPISGQEFKPQFAGKGSGTCQSPSDGVPATYTDVTAATIIAFNDNSPADGVSLIDNANDPHYGAVTTVNQTYEELNNITNSVSVISLNQAGQWDFALKENGVDAGTAYCFRMVKADGALLNSYTAYPEMVLSAPVYINEVYASGAETEDWIELYNNTSSTASLIGWKLNYIESTIDLGGIPMLLWTGQAEDEINTVSTFTITTSTDLKGAQSYYVELIDNADNIVSQVQWPGPGILSTGQSFARVIDGGSVFEIDPTATQSYANHISTYALKINEVSYGNIGEQFIEIYNTSLTSTQTMVGYALRNSAASENGKTFKFTRIIYPQNYALIDFSSYDDSENSYTAIFGVSGLNSAGDFLTLEDPGGSTIDEVTWQTDTNYTRYNYKAQKVSMEQFAPGNASVSIIRQPSEGSDTDNSLVDFVVASDFTTIASRNNNPATASANALHYPFDNGQPQFLAGTFLLTLEIGAVSSSATANNIVFTRVDGNADVYSPHIYRLQDIG